MKDSKDLPKDVPTNSEQVDTPQMRVEERTGCDGRKGSSHDDLERQEQVPWWALELGCWTMVVLAPILTCVNGPPVSRDQAVVRTVVFSLALIVGLVLTIARFVRRWRK